ncbi:MAG TPA: cupin domain-containing protein [Steroidobacteraceae bacterium]|nr:cupin domain-containing protein [Steroidobacteraceae bacterium]
MTMSSRSFFVTPAVPVRRLALALVLAAGAAAPTALATPGSGILSAPVVARGAFVDVTDLKFKITGHGQEVIHVNGSADTVVQQVVFAPGGVFGWHSHPGPVVVVIKSGELAFYEADDPTCTPRIYVAGDVFVDSGQGHVHFARNPSTTDNLELWATYFDVPPSASPRIDAPDPGNCTF